MSQQIVEANIEFAERVVAVLNDCFLIDPVATENLITSSAQCNERLADHPTVQCLKDDTGFVVRVLGLINGLCGVDAEGWGLVGALYDNGALKGFCVRHPASTDNREI